jgi:hypothetical protein
MKFALILEDSIQRSFQVRNKCAYRYGTDIIYEWHSSIKIDDTMTSMGPFAYPFIFEGDYLNWNELETLPDNDYDIIFCAVEKWPDRFNVEKIRKAYPNALIVGTIKELYFIKDYETRIKFFNDCDIICVPYKESFATCFPNIHDDVNKPIHWLPQGYDIDFLYKNFYNENRTESIFSYIAPHPPRRYCTEQFADALSKKYNIPIVRQEVPYTGIGCPQWFNFLELFKKFTFCINLDPEPQFGQQGVQSAILGVINIGGVNDSHFNLHPNTAHNDVEKLDNEFARYLEDLDYRNMQIENSFRKAEEIYSFKAVRNKFNKISKL